METRASKYLSKKCKEGGSHMYDVLTLEQRQLIWLAHEIETGYLHWTASICSRHWLIDPECKLCQNNDVIPFEGEMAYKYVNSIMTVLEILDE